MSLRRQQRPGITPDEQRRREELVEVLAPLQAATGRDWPEEQWTAWYLALGDLSAEAIGLAVARWLQTSGDGFPMPADVRSLAFEAGHGRLPDADECYEELAEAAKRYSEYDRELCGRIDAALHPVTRAALRACGGWRAVTDGDRQVFVGQFRKAHETVLRRLRERLVLSEHLRPRMAAAETVAEALGVASAKRLPGASPVRLIESVAAGLKDPDPSKPERKPAARRGGNQPKGRRAR